MTSSKKVNESVREGEKRRVGIRVSNYKLKKCGNCFFYNTNRVCGKHYIRTKKEEVCPDFRKISTTVYGGGRVNPK